MLPWMDDHNPKFLDFLWNVKSLIGIIAVLMAKMISLLYKFPLFKREGKMKFFICNLWILGLHLNHSTFLDGKVPNHTIFRCENNVKNLISFHIFYQSLNLYSEWLFGSQLCSVDLHGWTYEKIPLNCWWKLKWQLWWKSILILLIPLKSLCFILLE